MTIIYILLPLSVFLGFIFLAGYIWSVCTKQFEDLETPAVRILADEDPDFVYKKERK